MSDRTGTRIDLSTIPKGEPRRKAWADVVFVIDTTGSMSDKIDGLIKTCHRFADQVALKAVDWQIAVVAFGDLTVPGDTIQATGFNKNVEVVKRSLANLPRNSGGGNSGESSLEALEKSLGLKGYRPRATKVFILVTDEPALQTEVRADTMTEKLRRCEAITFVVSPPLGYFRNMAKRTGGAWFEVGPDTDFLSILRMFDRMTERVARTIHRVQLEAGGSVERYLGLPQPSD